MSIKGKGRMQSIGVLLVFALLLAGCSTNTHSNVSDSKAAETADLIITNGRIVTQDERGTIAQAAAVKGGRFIAVGNNEEVAQRRGVNTRVIAQRAHRHSRLERLAFAPDARRAFLQCGTVLGRCADAAWGCADDSWAGSAHTAGTVGARGRRVVA